MIVIVAGSRSVTSLIAVTHAIEDSGFDITELVSGGAKGADYGGEVWAKLHNVRTRVFQANWERDGRRAGFIRNGAMAAYAEALVAVWDGQSRGTLDMIDKMRMAGKPVFVKIYHQGTLGTTERAFNLDSESGTVLAQSKGNDI